MKIILSLIFSQLLTIFFSWLLRGYTVISFLFFIASLLFLFFIINIFKNKEGYVFGKVLLVLYASFTGGFYIRHILH